MFQFDRTRSATRLKSVKAIFKFDKAMLQKVESKILLAIERFLLIVRIRYFFSKTTDKK